MGSFIGHFISGALFVVFGSWHVCNVFLAYLRAGKRGTRFTSRICWTAPWRQDTTFPHEAIFKLGFVLVWGTVEFLVITWKPHHYGQQGQHGTMEYILASTGIVDFLVYANRNNRWPWLPRKADYAYNVFAYLMEKHILANHHPDKVGMHMNLEGFMHTFLTDVAMFMTVAVLVEMIFTHHIWAPILRTYLMVLQGTWLWTIGFTIYYGTPLEDRHENYQLLALYFSYCCLVTIIYCFVIGAITHAIMGFPKIQADEFDETIKDHKYSLLPVTDTVTGE